MKTEAEEGAHLRKRRHGVPDVGAHLVRRERLLRLLDDYREDPVISLQAPGGFGKSSVLSQWAALQDRAVAWLTVRPQAPNAEWLVEAVVAALRDVGLLEPSADVPIGADPVEWHLATLPALERLLDSIKEPFLLVIDDASAITGDTWESLAASLAAAVPRGSQLVLATRGELPSSLQRLRANDGVGLIGADRLALDAVEGAELLATLAPKLADSDVLGVLEATEGWPVAVYLAGRSLAHGLPIANVRALAATGELAQYFRAEILRPLAHTDASFLLRVSVLTLLDEPTCQAVTGTSNALERLRRLSHTNHLLVPVDADGDRFRIHPLLATFLGEELRAHDPDAWHSTHAAASRALEAAGDVRAAVYHARLSGDDDRLGALVWRQAARLISRAQTPVLHRWLAAVDDHRIRAQVELALTAGYMAAQSGDSRRMNQMILSVESLVRAGRSDLRPDADLLRALSGWDAPGRAAEYLRTCIAAKDPTDEMLTLAYYVLGAIDCLDGRSHQGVQWLSRGLLLADTHQLPLMQARLLAALAQDALGQADTARALRLIQRSRDVLARHRFDYLASVAPALAVSARGYLMQGQLPQARAEAATALQLLSRMNAVIPWLGIQARLTIAEVFLAFGDVATAQQMVSEIDQLSIGRTGLSVLDHAVEETRARVRATPRTPGAADSVLTMAELRVLQYLPTHLSYPDIARLLSVSPHTVKTQALAVFRKLDAHSRNEAIHTARERGLLPPALTGEVDGPRRQPPSRDQDRAEPATRAESPTAGLLR